MTYLVLPKGLTWWQKLSVNIPELKPIFMQFSIHFIWRKHERTRPPFLRICQLSRGGRWTYELSEEPGAVVHFHLYQDAADCREQTFFLLKSFDTLLENFSAHICPGLVVICFVTKTRPGRLFVNYQMSRKKRKDPVGSTLRYDMMSYKVFFFFEL